MKKYSGIFLAIIILQIAAFAQSNEWKMKSAPLMTPWSEKVDPQNVLPEYPRPQLVRDRWQNLNGVWEFQESNEGDPIPFEKDFKEKILVPFPWESAISGIHRFIPSYRAFYRRMFSIPKEWNGENVLLNFGAVDWEATVYVNGRCVVQHKGGYDAFTVNITKYLNKKDENELIVAIYDPGSSRGISIGKQSNDRFDNPHDYSYTSSSGIWQTVWLEPVSSVTHIEAVKIIPDIDQQLVKVSSSTFDKVDKSNIEVTVLDEGKVVATAKGNPYKEIVISIKEQKLWTPDSPFLYDLKIALKDSTGKVIDNISSYFGMRKISLGQVENYKKLFFNNKFLFQMGPLDQGYWPDGIYTAPTDEALKWDIQTIKDWGYNMVRKHIKVEPQRWYYWCDKLGLLVWQDMPSTWNQRTEDEKVLFQSELEQMVRQHWNHPSIVLWVVFNEHWGIFDVHRLTENVMALDPTRMVTGNSGIDAARPSVNFEVGHVVDNHSYRPPRPTFPSSTRALVHGEYGAIGYLQNGHIWDIDGPWVHYNYDGKEAATVEYETFINQIIKSINRDALSAAIYTQVTDVENEVNGFVTYDRKVEKLDKERVRKANVSTYSDK